MWDTGAVRVLAVAAVVLAAGCGNGHSGGGAPNPKPQAQAKPKRDDAPIGSPAFKRAVLDFNGHVVVLKSTGGFLEHREVAARIAAVKGVTRVLPMVVAEARIAGAGDELVVVKGIEVAASPVARYVTPPRALDGHQPGTAEVPVALGVELARRLDAQIGDTFEVEVPPDLMTVDGSGGPRTRQVRVVATLELWDEYDKRVLLTSLAGAQAIVRRGDDVLGLEVLVDRLDDAPRIAGEIDALLGPPYDAIDWCELNKASLGC